MHFPYPPSNVRAFGLLTITVAILSNSNQVVTFDGISSTLPSTVSLHTDNSTSATPSSAAILTTNVCYANSVNQRSNLPDCHCPPGFGAVSKYKNENRMLCASLRAPGPWHDGCTASGTSIDYYDLKESELTAVNDFLSARNVWEFWLSARRLVSDGVPVRRLPGKRWNEEMKVNGESVSEYREGYDCVARGGANFTHMTLRNCTQALPLLCLYQESPMPRLHCEKKEVTTRYADLQRFCFSVVKNTTEMQPENGVEIFKVDNPLKRQLLDELTLRRRCRATHFIANDKDSLQTGDVHHMQKRAQHASTYSGHQPEVGSVSSSLGLEELRTCAVDCDCIAFERLSIQPLNLFTTNGTTPRMYLYFEKPRHKLFLTVYGRRWFWREQFADSGFRCFTRDDYGNLLPVESKRLRAPRVRGRPMNQTETGYTVRTMYELKLKEDGPPRGYWCEAHLVPDFTHIMSQHVLANRKPQSKSFFAVSIELRLNRIVDGPPEAIHLRDAEKHIDSYIKQLARVSEWKPIFGAIKTWHVKKVDSGLASPGNGSYTVRLLLHVVMECWKKWNKKLLSEGVANEIELPEKYLYYYRARHHLSRAFESLNNASFHTLGVNSTEYCLPDSLKMEQARNIWWVGRLGETVAPRNLCVIEHSGLPISRRCLGDYLYGCSWDREPGGVECSHQVHHETRALYEYSVCSLNQTILLDVFHKAGDLLTGSVDVIPADLFYVSKSLENAQQILLPEGTTMTFADTDVVDSTIKEYICHTANILSRVMYQNETTVVLSQRALNTTNILLDATENIIKQLALSSNSHLLMHGEQYDCQSPTPLRQQHDTENDGTVLFRSSRLIVLIADPTVANISGLALFRRRQRAEAVSHSEPKDGLDDTTVEEDFNDYSLRYLYMNQSLQLLLEEADLEVGSFIPQLVIDNLDVLRDEIAANDDEVPDGVYTTTDIPNSPSTPVTISSLRVIITVYYNDLAFRETKSGPIARPNAKIVSITIPGYGSQMPDVIPIYIREEDDGRAGGRCGYWSFDAENRTEFGHWSYEECRLLNASGSLALCGCFHLTSFSRLTMDTQMVETAGVSQKFIADKGSVALEIISVIGCSLSLLGVIGIFATAILFPSWRVKASSKILLQLSCAIAIEMMIIFLEGPDIDQHKTSQIECALLGSTFHYIILVTFTWMLITAYLQFMRYVKVLGRLRPAHFVLKATLFCWGAPLLIVVACLASDYRLYLKRNNLTDICYPHGAALWYGLLLPIGTIIFINLVSFVFVMYNIFTLPTNLTKTADNDVTFAQLRLSVFLFFLLGLPWIFGMLTTGTEDKIFAYLFCLTAPIQGFVLFIYFVIMDPTARRLWYRKLQHCPWVRPSDKPTVTSSPSVSLNTYL